MLRDTHAQEYVLVLKDIYVLVLVDMCACEYLLTSAMPSSFYIKVGKAVSMYYLSVVQQASRTNQELVQILLGMLTELLEDGFLANMHKIWSYEEILKLWKAL